MKPFIRIHITREDLVEREACKDEVARFDRICGANPGGDLVIDGSLNYVNSIMIVFARYWPVGLFWAASYDLIPQPDLRRANLAGANLYGANLYGANLAGADLDGANLAGADLRGATMPVNWEDAVWEDAVWRKP